MTDFQPTTTSYRQGARTLPGESYTSASILAEERERIFARSWNCVGRASRIARPGDYFLCEVAGESLIVVRDSKGAARSPRWLGGPVVSELPLGGPDAS